MTPLCIDLDGTLVRSDLLIEATLVLIKQNPLYLFLLPVWLARGKAALKQAIAARVDLDMALLPYHEALCDWIREQRALGRATVLATASHRKFADAVAAHLGLFDAVYATGDGVNLSGCQKRDRLVAAFGAGGFDYAGNDRADLPVWSKARAAILVGASAGVARQAAASAAIERVFPAAPAGWQRYARAIRVHQWLKNLLIFVPLVMAHQVTDPRLLLQAAIAFASFCLCASSVYVLNDLLDLDSDRRHPSKRRRAFAAGTIPIARALLLIPALLGGAFGLALLLPGWFLATLGVYYLATLAYSLRLKRVVLIDVMLLALLYTIRVIAGGTATGLGPSFWLLAFSMFLFLSLALVKRYAEFLTVHGQARTTAAGRGYQIEDMEALSQFGIASGYASVLVLALYINSSDVEALYGMPEALWLICPLFLYWVSRVWLLTRRNQMHDDPILFAIGDRQSHGLFVVMAAILWFAI